MPSTDTFWCDASLSKKQNIFNLLCSLLIASTFFSLLLHLRYSGNKIQLTEILFLLTLPFIPYKQLFQYQWKTNRTLFILLGTYLFFDLLSSLLSRQATAILESLGRCYLVALFAVLNFRFSMLQLNDALAKVARIFFYAAILTGITAAIGYIKAILGMHSRFLMFFDHYPYFGRLYRLRGANIYPSMFISIITLPILYLVAVYKSVPHKKQAAIALAVLFICAALTLSKSILLIGFGVLAFILKRWGWLNRATLWVSGILITAFLLLSTHVIIVKHNSTEEKEVLPTVFTSSIVLFQFNGYDALETDYLTAKRTELNAAPHHLLLGVGTGNFNKVVHQYKSRGLFPLKFQDMDPHCTYLGSMVENGLLGLIALLAVFIYLLRRFIAQPRLLSNNLLLGLFLIYITFLIDAVDTDILNFRHLWMFLALAVFCLDRAATDQNTIKSPRTEVAS